MMMKNQAYSPRVTRPILHFTNSKLWGGVEEHVCGLLGRLSHDLFCPELVCSVENYARFRSACPQSIKVTPLHLDGLGDVAAAFQLAKILLRGKHMIVHSHMFWGSLFASPIAWACGVPVIIETLHGSEAWRTGWKSHVNIDRVISEFMTMHIAVSDYDLRHLAGRKHIPVEKIRVIHNGIDLHRFTGRRTERECMRQSIGLAEKDHALILVARFHPGKGHRVLLAAMRLLLDAHPDLHLICVGEGEGLEEIKLLSHELDLAEHLHFVGYQRDVQAWLQAADINVLPSFYEGFPLTVLEAMASGLPTIASCVGGIPEAIEDGVSGLLVPAGNPGKLAGAISSLLLDTSARERMGEAACRRARLFFSIEQQVNETERLYCELCDACIPALLEKSGVDRTVRSDRPAITLPIAGRQ